MGRRVQFWMVWLFFVAPLVAGGCPRHRTEVSLAPQVDRTQEAGRPEGGRPEVNSAVEMDRLALYEPVRLEILKFTKPRDSNQDRQFDQLHVFVAVYNDLGHEARGFGTFRLELYDYRQASADRRGQRLGFWQVPVDSRETQRKYWDPITRIYEFKLDCRFLPPNRKFVIEVTYIGLAKQRLSDVFTFEVPRPPGQFGDQEP